MADTQLTVRHNNFLKLNWTFKNYVAKTVIGLTVDKDPGTGLVAIAPAEDGQTGADGKGEYMKQMPNVGTFVYTLTAKKKPFDELRKFIVTVKELEFTKFEVTHAKIWLTEAISINWQIDAGEGCTFKLVTTLPDGTTKEDGVSVDNAGKGVFKVTPAVKGTHQYKLIYDDPTIATGQAKTVCPVLKVEVRESKPGFVFDYADAKKPSVRITFRDSSFVNPPAFKIQNGEKDFENKAGAMALAKDGSGDVPGQWEAVVDVAPRLKVIPAKVWKSKGEMTSKGFKPIFDKTFWFKKPAKDGDPPQIMEGKPPDRKGKIGVANLDPAALDKLSARRRKIVAHFLTEVMPSDVGTPEFDKLQTKKSIDDTLKVMKGYSTCVTVPSFLNARFGEQPRAGRNTIGGIAGCFWAAHDSGGFVDAGHPAWITAQTDLNPQPGDIFLITNKKTTPAQINAFRSLKPGETRSVAQQNHDVFECLHVGVVIDTHVEQVTVAGFILWVVAEAGQADNAALYDLPSISRDASGNALLGERRLAGWVDVANYLPWTFAYNVFKASDAAVHVGKSVTLSWSIAAHCPTLCSYQLVTTLPDGTVNKTDVKITTSKMIGEGSTHVKLTVPGVHKFRLDCADPSLKAGETLPQCPEVSVTATPGS